MLNLWLSVVGKVVLRWHERDFKCGVQGFKAYGGVRVLVHVVVKGASFL